MKTAHAARYFHGPMYLIILGCVRASLYKFTLSSLFVAALAGCLKTNLPPSDAAAEARQAAQDAQPAKDTARQEIEGIPPPAKSRYLAVHTENSWANPFLTVGREGDPHAGDLARRRPRTPTAREQCCDLPDARKQELDIRHQPACRRRWPRCRRDHGPMGG